jgi:hypothetical protein
LSAASLHPRRRVDAWLRFFWVDARADASLRARPQRAVLPCDAEVHDVITGCGDGVGGQRRRSRVAPPAGRQDPAWRVRPRVCTVRLLLNFLVDAPSTLRSMRHTHSSYGLTLPLSGRLHRVGLPRAACYCKVISLDSLLGVAALLTFPQLQLSCLRCHCLSSPSPRCTISCTPCSHKLETRRRWLTLRVSCMCVWPCRGAFAVEISRVVVHSSDSAASAEREVALWFPEGAAAGEGFHPCTAPWTQE